MGKQKNAVLPRRRIRDSRADKTFYAVNGVVTVLLFVVYAWPLWFVLISSVSDPNLVQAGEVLLWPKGFHLEGYKLIVEYKDILRGYWNSIVYTVVGTAINLIMTVCAAYPLSRRDFMPRKILAALFIFTMYFSGGLIPTFLQVKNLGLYNTPWAMMIPCAVSIYNVLILRSFFMYGIPASLEEAAVLDGANTFQMLWHVMLPLVKPTLAVLVLYYAVGHWNDYFSALIYLKDKTLMPLQSVLRDVLIVGKIDMQTGGMEMEAIIQKMKQAQTLKYSVIVVSTVPLILVYPFIQKHFVKGIMVGAVKG